MSRNLLAHLERARFDSSETTLAAALNPYGPDALPSEAHLARLRRVLKRLARRGVVRCVGTNWVLVKAA